MADIWLLADTDSMTPDELELVEQFNWNYPLEGPTFKQKKIRQVGFEKIKRLLNGQGRMILYECYNKITGAYLFFDPFGNYELNYPY